ncbi:hypothetical protein ACGFX4_14285 [Kitasatospora sp. NPDC048365]|uniref:hypothetical protein n=1 Tax=Kitasatospora sp. NPDC048365 TaxID=3364050 RepID=UPI00371793B3
MYAIRVGLSAPAGTAEPAEPAVRSALSALLRMAGARLEHARFRSAPGELSGVCFLAAGSLLEAERLLGHACRVLTVPFGPLAGWRLERCEADPWIALGLHEAPAEN